MMKYNQAFKQHAVEFYVRHHQSLSAVSRYFCLSKQSDDGLLNINIRVSLIFNVSIVSIVRRNQETRHV